VMTCDNFVSQQAVMWMGDVLVGSGPSAVRIHFPLNQRQGKVVGSADRPETYSGTDHITRPFLYDGVELRDLGRSADHWAPRSPSTRRERS